MIEEQVPPELPTLAANPMAPNRALRRRLVERFESWLDDLLARDEPPIGIAADLLAELEAEDDDVFDTEGGDLYSLWSAVTALTQEVKLQGRAFKRLADEIAHGLHDEDRSDRDDELERRLGRRQIETLLDLRDRLDRGLATARTHLRALESRPARGSWLRRRLGRRGPDELLDATSALEKGYVLGLERLDEELRRLGAELLPALGRTFDPHTMTVVEVEHEALDGDAEGTVLEVDTVLEVPRPGYAWRGEILRPAEVKVRRIKA